MSPRLPTFRPVSAMCAPHRLASTSLHSSHTSSNNWLKTSSTPSKNGSRKSRHLFTTRGHAALSLSRPPTSVDQVKIASSSPDATPLASRCTLESDVACRLKLVVQCRDRVTFCVLQETFYSQCFPDKSSGFATFARLEANFVQCAQGVVEVEPPTPDAEPRVVHQP